MHTVLEKIEYKIISGANYTKMESWLRERELGNLVEIFSKEDLTFDDFPQITIPTLKSLGVTYGNAFKFEREWKKYVEHLSSKPNTPQTTTSSKINPKPSSRDTSSLAFYPIAKHELHELFKQQRAVLWTPQEISHADDRSDWDNLDENTANFLEFILCFFAQMDGLINENLIENFKKETSFYKEAKNFYTLQEYVELVHNEVYSNLIEAFIRDPKKKERAFNAIQHYPAIKKIADLVEKWMDNSRPLMERIIAFACVEGIMFQSAFAAIYWIKKRNILAALCLANEWIARDEGIHTLFAITLYHTIVQDGIFPAVAPERIQEIVNEFVDVAEVFNTSALKVDMIGMNLKDMMGYVKCIADCMMTKFGGTAFYNEENKFGEWMALIGLPSKSNFFEKTVTEYGKDDKVDFTFSFTKDY